jgi:hypothetical protein
MQLRRLGVKVIPMKWLCDTCWPGNEELTIGGFINDGICDGCGAAVDQTALHAMRGEPSMREPWCDDCVGEPYAAHCRHPKPLVK